MCDLAEKAVEHALNMGASYAEARFEKILGSAVILKNGLAEPSVLTDEVGVGIRALCDGGLAFTSTNFLDLERVEKAVESCVKMARALSARRKLRLSREEFGKESWSVQAKENPLDVSFEDKLQKLADLDKAALAAGVDLPSRLFTLSTTFAEKLYVNSEGAEVRSSLFRVRFSLFVTAHEHGKGVAQRHLELGETGGWERVRGWSLEDKVLEEVAVLKNLLREGRRAPPGLYDVVLGSELTGIVSHEACGHPQEADRVLGREAAQAGESYLKPGDLGKVVGSEAVTIIDDPTLPNSFGYYLYDDEGVEARRKILIKSGVVNEYLHNRETAAEFGVKSNGSARAMDYSREPIVRMANTFMIPGDYSFQELIEDVKSGIYVKTYLEWNIDDVRWNNRYVGLEAYLIESGEIKNPLRNPVIEVTTGKLLSSIDAVGRELSFRAATCGKGMPMQGVPVWIGGPEARARNIYVKPRE